MPIPVTREECRRRLGNMEQVACVRRAMMLEGRAAGMEMMAVTCGDMQFLVLPGRGMDIAEASFRGIPIAYRTKAEISHPGYHDRRNMQWLQSFFGGLLTTCGLQNAGPPCEEELPIVGVTPFGLHGDISNTGADNICSETEWVDGQYRIRLSGRMQEGRLHGEHLQLRRTITTYLGKRTIMVDDLFSNEGTVATPLTFFYHINLGYPLLSEEARLLIPTRKVVPASEEAEKYLSSYDSFEPPEKDYLERQYYHTLNCDAKGYTEVALVNPQEEIGVALGFFPSQLPCFSEWKVCREGEYVLAFEPGNCYPQGRAALREKGCLQVLEPGEQYAVHFEIRMLHGADELQYMETKCRELEEKQR